MINSKIDKKTIYETLRFGLVGILNTIVGYGTYYIFVKLNINYVLSSLMSQIIGVTHSYFWNKYFTFKSKSKSLLEIYRFISVYVFTFLINIGILSFLIEKIYIGKEEAGFIAMMAVTILSFIGHKFWSFNKRLTDSKGNQ